MYDRCVAETGFFIDRYRETRLADGRLSYNVDGIPNREANEGTDLRAILDRYVSVGIATNIS